jgi:putative protein-disulfide isomerase
MRSADPIFARHAPGSTATLYYIHDPMCSWCYAFAPSWRQVVMNLPAGLRVEYLVGGLAPDTDAPMPEDMRAYIQSVWRRIQSHVPGTEFNFRFWDVCQPRRSTFPACRAVLAARYFDPALELVMIERIQSAYYREARNPSDSGILCELAAEIGLEPLAFRDWMNGSECEAALRQQFERVAELGVAGFPSLVLQREAELIPVPVNFREPGAMLAALNAI